jgi:predicted N-acyltransferase
MADPDPELTARIARGVAMIDAGQWNRLAGKDPLTGHAFLSSFEESASVGDQSGWAPLPIMVERGGRIVGAAPAYLKTHSQGEYVFDHGWAEAFERAGGNYYPKLLIAVPFTPCPGARLLGDSTALLAAIEAVTTQNNLSSAHMNFCTNEEADKAEARGWLVRHGIQFHWPNRGYADFQAFLDTLSSGKRKTIRRERARAIEGLTILTLRGPEIHPDHWDAMWHFYQDTGARKWGQPYLTRDWFNRAGDVLGDSALMFIALREGQPIAGALNIIEGDTLYGRYWGASEEVPFLHFELSYYRAMDWAISNGIATVQAGAQGEHKLARGYEPVLTRSAHFIPNASFKSAIADFLIREREAINREMMWCREALPYRQR